MRAKFEVLGILKEISKDRTIIVSHHDLNTVNDYCDYVHFIKKGSIVDSGLCNDVFTKKNVEIVFDVVCNIIDNEVLKLSI